MYFQLRLFLITISLVIVTTIKGRLSLHLQLHIIMVLPASTLLPTLKVMPPKSNIAKGVKLPSTCSGIKILNFLNISGPMDHALPGLLPLDLGQDTNLKYDEACSVSAHCALLDALYLDGN